MQKKKSRPKKILVILLIVILVLVLCCGCTTFGYIMPRVNVIRYLWGISDPLESTNKAALVFDKFEQETDLSTTFDEDEQSILQFKKSFQDFQKTLRRVEKDIERSRASVNKMQAPHQARDVHHDFLRLLDSDLDFLEVMDDCASYFIRFADAMVILARITPEMEKEPPEEQQAYIDYIKNIKGQLDEARKILEEQPPPALLTDLNRDFVDLLRTSSEAYGLLMEAAQTGDSSKIDEANRKFAEIDQLDAQFDKDEQRFTKSLDKIASNEEKQVNKINAELRRLRIKNIPLYTSIFE